MDGDSLAADAEDEAALGATDVTADGLGDELLVHAPATIATIATVAKP